MWVQAQTKRRKRIEEETKARAEEASRMLDSGPANPQNGGGDNEELKQAKQRAQDHLKERQEEELEKIRREDRAEAGGGSSEDTRKETDEINRKEIERRAKEQGSWEDKPYEVLGLEVDCTSKDIKKAYRKLSLMLHPDKVRLGAACTNVPQWQPRACT